MKLTATTLRPVVTLLSGSRGASQSAVVTLERFFNMEEIKLSSATNNDALDNAYKPFLRKGFESVGCLDKESGTILHFLTLNDSRVETDLILLAITDSSQNDDDAVKCVQETRNEIAQHIDKSWKNSVKLLAMQSIGSSISPQDLTSLDNGLPLLVLPANNESESSACISETKAVSSLVKLREIAIPCNFESTYADGSSLMQKLSQSNLSRPKTGLYQWPASSPADGVILRPLPSANADWTLTYPSFIFQCESLQAKNDALKEDALLTKVGRNSTVPGQLMIHHPDLQGIEMRYCETNELSSSFAEAQESLMAGSLDDLQNANVMVEGGNTRSLNDVEITVSSSKAIASKKKVDVMNGLGDCWVEFRANIKRPQGFFDKKARTKTMNRIAKAPDLPYE